MYRFRLVLAEMRFRIEDSEAKTDHGPLRFPRVLMDHEGIGCSQFMSPPARKDKVGSSTPSTRISGPWKRRYQVSRGQSCSNESGSVYFHTESLSRPQTTVFTSYVPQPPVMWV